MTYLYVIEKSGSVSYTFHFVFLSVPDETSSTKEASSPNMVACFLVCIAKSSGSSLPRKAISWFFVTNHSNVTQKNLQYATKKLTIKTSLILKLVFKLEKNKSSYKIWSNAKSYQLYVLVMHRFNWVLARYYPKIA